MTPGAQHWQRVYARRADFTEARPLSACQKRRVALRAAGLCIFCGRSASAVLCDGCRERQGQQQRARYREMIERTEGRSVRPYRRP